MDLELETNYLLLHGAMHTREFLLQTFDLFVAVIQLLLDMLSLLSLRLQAALSLIQGLSDALHRALACL